jgi:hypothetical protein
MTLIFCGNRVGLVRPSTEDFRYTDVDLMAQAFLRYQYLEPASNYESVTSASAGCGTNDGQTIN